MLSQCIYKETTPLNFCIKCSLFLETCTYVVSKDGLAIGAECDIYLCPDCNESCIYKTFINL